MIKQVKGCSRRDTKKAMHHVRVSLNGADVTNRCFYADDKGGVVRLYHDDGKGPKHGALGVLSAPPTDGRRLFNGFDGALTVERHGKVRIERAA